jgi:hypothetical protein
MGQDFACHAEPFDYAQDKLCEASRSWLAERVSSLAPLAQNDTIWLVGLRRSFTRDVLFWPTIRLAVGGGVGKRQVRPALRELGFGC